MSIGMRVCEVRKGVVQRSEGAREVRGLLGWGGARVSGLGAVGRCSVRHCMGKDGRGSALMPGGGEVGSGPG